MMLVVFELIAMWALLALFFVLGRVWEIRQQDIRRSRELDAGLQDTKTAHLPIL
jgi:hypothetical protein